MAVLKPRERLVYFRVSEDEFHQFTSLCEQQGARSVSDLARSAVQRLIAARTQQQEERELAPKVAMLEKLLGDLNSQLEQLSRLLSVQQASGRTMESNVNTNGNGPGAAMHTPE